MNPAEPPRYLPASAAVIVHEPERDHIAFLDLVSGRVQLLEPEVERPKGLVVSPDGQWLGYSSRTTLFVREGDGTGLRTLTQDLDVTATPPYAFQPGAPSIAISVTKSILILSLSEASGAAPSLRFPLADGCRVSQLLWSPSGNTLYLLCAPPPNVKEPWIVTITPASRAMKTVSAPGVTRLLGFRSETDLIAGRTAGAGDEALISSQPGEYQLLRPLKEEEFISAYIAPQGRFVIVQGIEDGGDPTILCLAGPGPCTPWLPAFRHVTDLNFSRDGLWAVFIERPATDAALPGGAVHLAATESAETRRVLQATAERSYSAPVFRPAGR